MAGAYGSGPGAVALIGTAIMGSAMARHLAAGLPVRCRKVWGGLSPATGPLAAVAGHGREDVSAACPALGLPADGG